MVEQEASSFAHKTFQEWPPVKQEYGRLNCNADISGYIILFRNITKTRKESYEYVTPLLYVQICDK